VSPKNRNALDEIEIMSLTMNRISIGLCALLLLVLTACQKRTAVADNHSPPVENKVTPETPAPIQASGKTLRYNFDSDRPDRLPANFHEAMTGQGTRPQWVVKSDPTAPSPPNVLAQISNDKTDYRFPLAIADEASFQDLELSVRFKTVSGSIDQAAGMVFRLKDANNYYIARANALENNYRLYHVVDGKRVQFAGANLKVVSSEWHELRVECVGNHIICYFDNEKRIDATDDTFKSAGKVGLWTKADSVTYFDDFQVKAK